MLSCCKKTSHTILSFFTTVGFSGYLPKMPGTWGSLVAMILAYFIMPHFYYPYFALLTAILFVLGVFASSIHAQKLQMKDPKCIVIDELVGLWVACLVFAYFCPLSPLYLVLLFLAFRFFDITKKPFIHRTERLKGGLGIMADDLVAGIYAGVLMVVLYKVYELLLSYYPSLPHA